MTPESLAFARDLGDSGTRVRWLGAAGFAITHGAHTVLIDPYVTRASLARCIAGAVAPDTSAIRAHVPHADAIVVGHTHFDHALDVPAIARLTGAKVFGSTSAVVLCRSQGVPESQIECVEAPREVVREVGPFVLRFEPSAHSRFLFGRVPFPGDIADCDDVPLRVTAYRCGAVFTVTVEVAGKKICHVGSAELRDDSLRAKNVDLALVAVAGWTSSERFPERAMQKLAPGAVLLSHWDNFMRPMDRGASPLPALALPRFVERLTREARDVAIGTVPLLGAIGI